MNYYDNTLSYYKIIVHSMVKDNPNVKEDVAREAFNYFMNNLDMEERKTIINEMRYATALLEVLISNGRNTELRKEYLGSVNTCVESILICFANGALLSINALFMHMHEQILEMTGYRGVFGNMDTEYRNNYIRG